MLTISSKQNVQSATKSKSFGLGWTGSNPVIKISREGILIYANTAGIEFLEMVSSALKAPAINYILKTNPKILRPNCSTDVSFRVNQLKFYFSAVSFDEAGYIGLYGYRIVRINIAGNMVA